MEQRSVRALMSFVLSWVRGLSIFVTMTASFCIAMTIAISGPPTASEVDLLRTAFVAALREAGEAARRVGDQTCADLPSDARGALCDRGDERASLAAPEAPKPPAEEAIAPARSADAPIALNESVADSASPQTDLLGGPARGARAAPARASERAAQRRANARPSRAQPARAAPDRRRTPRAQARRHQPAPLLRAGLGSVPPLPPARESAQLTEAPDIGLTELLDQEQEEISAYDRDWADETEAREDPYYDDRYYSEDPYFEEAPSSDEEDYYGEPYPYELWEN